MGPLLLFAAQRVGSDPATTFARSLAIANAAPLLADIERYRLERGCYPPSLHSVSEDYAPDVIGVERYRNDCPRLRGTRSAPWPVAARGVVIAVA